MFIIPLIINVPFEIWDVQFTVVFIYRLEKFTLTRYFTTENKEEEK